MYRKIKEIDLLNLCMTLCTAFLPFSLRFLPDLLLGFQIDFINYYPEIYSFNAIMFIYNYIYLDKRLNIFKIYLLIFVLSTCVYSTNYFIHPQSKLFFACFMVLTILNLVLSVTIIMTAQGNHTDGYYEKYPENRYERYLLERIDEKLNLIKNPKSEESEKEICDAKNSEELLNGSDILAEMLKNHIEIKEYFRISKNQSKFSFYFSILSSVVGIIVIIIAAFGITAFKEISIIAALSGAVTEIMSGIVLWIHNKSALQLNYYYDSLHENEKFLSAVNIADKLSEGKKEDMYIEIIRKQIEIQTRNKESTVSDENKT